MGVDGDRATCLDCLSTLVRNTADAQPLYDDVLGLYASFGMPLPVRPPLLLVGATCQVLMLSPCCLQPLLVPRRLHMRPARSCCQRNSQGS